MDFQFLWVEEFTRKNGLLLVFVRIKGGDALLGRTVFFVSKTFFLKFIHIPVPREQKRGTIADF